MMQAKALYLSHGGGPLPLLGDAAHQEMVACLTALAQQIRRPSAIIVISAHWEAAQARITAAANPTLIYDYYGFPEQAYSIQYPCSGAPALAKQAAQALQRAGIATKLDDTRGFDHGLFVPLTIMYPEADIPCIQISLINSLDPATHIAIGQALQSIIDNHVLVIGSGFSFHHMQAFFAPSNAEIDHMNQVFEDWLIDTCHNPNLSEVQRRQRLLDWEQAPSARFCHPREEHLLPLHVCYGVAQSACQHYYPLTILGKKSSIYLW